MLYEGVHDPDMAFNEQLRMETGWGEVASGLTKVLFGYGFMFLGTCIGFGLVVISMYNLTDPAEMGKKVANAANAKPNLAGLWCLYLGLGILSVIGLISYTIIIGGQFRCMMGAVERNGTRWFMFLCIACLFFSPAFHLASGIANWEALRELRHNPRRIETFQLNPMGQWLQLIGFGIGMLYPLFFTLFLRATAVSLKADAHVLLINIFVTMSASLVAATGYVLFEHRPGTTPVPEQQAMMIGLGWGVALLMYVSLIAMTRVCIYTTMSKVKSPLDM
jgi:hypothetical protein